MKIFFLHLDHWQKGLVCGIVLFLALFLSDLFQLIKGYSGTCGDRLSKDAYHYSCSLLHYILNDPFYGLYHGINAKLTWTVYFGITLLSIVVFTVFGLVVKKATNKLPDTCREVYFKRGKKAAPSWISKRTSRWSRR
ncbi:MAG: hypothetical protein NTZ13_04785 [Candidatus Parcubacteria bacterium]|nr:hypothetical protein [Candidatus Parcubacteria bacterium]